MEFKDKYEHGMEGLGILVIPLPYIFPSAVSSQGPAKTVASGCQVHVGPCAIPYCCCSLPSEALGTVVLPSPLPSVLCSVTFNPLKFKGGQWDGQGKDPHHSGDPPNYGSSTGFESLL